MAAWILVRTSGSEAGSWDGASPESLGGASPESSEWEGCRMPGSYTGAVRGCRAPDFSGQIAWQLCQVEVFNSGRSAGPRSADLERSVEWFPFILVGKSLHRVGSYFVANRRRRS